MTILVQRKFGINSQFLDTTIQAEDERLPGESIEEGIMRVYKQLEVTAGRMRKEANQDSSGLAYVPTTHMHKDVFMPEVTTYYPPGNLPTISRDKERLEIAIDNAETVEGMKMIKEAFPLMPASLIDYYNKKMTELTTGRPDNFTEGLT